MASPSRRCLFRSVSQHQSGAEGQDLPLEGEQALDAVDLLSRLELVE